MRARPLDNHGFLEQHGTSGSRGGGEMENAIVRDTVCGKLGINEWQCEKWKDPAAMNSTPAGQGLVCNAEC